MEWQSDQKAVRNNINIDQYESVPRENDFKLIILVRILSESQTKKLGCLNHRKLMSDEESKNLPKAS